MAAGTPMVAAGLVVALWLALTVAAAPPHSGLVVASVGQDDRPTDRPVGPRIAVDADATRVAFDTATGFDVPVGVEDLSYRDVFVRDLANATTTRVSRGYGGGVGDGDSYGAWMGADGRFVVYTSAATNLQEGGDRNGVEDVYLRDMSINHSVIASVGYDGQPSFRPSRAMGVSDDGRFVLFDSDSPDFDPSDSNQRRDVILRDMAAATNLRVSLDQGGRELTDDSYSLGLSREGRYVLWQTTASVLPTDLNGRTDVYRLDTVDGTITRASVDPRGAELGIDCTGALSGDGQRAIVECGDGGQYLLADMASGSTTDVTAEMAKGFGAHEALGMDGTGRRVAFVHDQAWVYDAPTNLAVRVSVSAVGTMAGNRPSTGMALSADGAGFAFVTASSNLADEDVNGIEDVFVGRLTAAAIPPPPAAPPAPPPVPTGPIDDGGAAGIGGLAAIGVLGALASAAWTNARRPKRPS